MCVGACGGQKRARGLLELELEEAGPVQSRHWKVHPLQEQQASYPLSHLSSPQEGILALMMICFPTLETVCSQELVLLDNFQNQKCQWIEGSCFCTSSEWLVPSRYVYLHWELTT